MPTVKFKVETQAGIKRVELEESTGFVPINLNNNNVGTKQLATGYDGVAVLYLQGALGQKAKFKITQDVAGVDVVLAERNHIKISSQNGKSTSSVPFIVQ